MPRAPNAYASSAWSGWSALARMPSVRTLSAHDEQLAEALVDGRVLGLHLLVEHLEDLARLGLRLADLHLAGEAVEGDVVAFLDGLAADA